MPWLVNPVVLVNDPAAVLLSLEAVRAGDETGAEDRGLTLDNHLGLPLQNEKDLVPQIV